MNHRAGWMCNQHRSKRLSFSLSLSNPWVESSALHNNNQTQQQQQQQQQQQPRRRGWLAYPLPATPAIIAPNKTKEKHNFRCIKKKQYDIYIYIYIYYLLVPARLKRLWEKTVGHWRPPNRFLFFDQRRFFFCKEETIPRTKLGNNSVT